MDAASQRPLRRQQRLDYYQRHWGRASSVGRDAQQEIDLLCFDPTPRRNHHTLATSGLVECQGVELLMYLRGVRCQGPSLQPPWPAELLLRTAQALVGRGIRPKPEQALVLWEADNALPGSELAVPLFLYDEEGPDFGRDLDAPQGLGPIEFLRLDLLTPAEHRFYCERGAAALMDLLEDHAHPATLDPDRGSYV